MEFSPRKLWGGSTAKTIKSEKGAASARFALLAAYLVLDKYPKLSIGARFLFRATFCRSNVKCVDVIS